MSRKNEKMLRVLGDEEISKVVGGATSQPHHSAAQNEAAIGLLGLAMDYPAGSAWNVFFASAAGA
jgi:hypothetical protein